MQPIQPEWSLTIYKLVQISRGLAERTRREWTQQLESHGGEILETPFLRILDWADKYAAGNGDANVYVYALVPEELEEGTEYAHAIMEISHARPKSDQPWLKVLSVHVQPAIDLDYTDSASTDALQQNRDIFAFSIRESFRLTYKEKPSVQLKLYGRTDHMLGFFEGIVPFFDDVDGINVKIQGRWLVFDKSGNGGASK